MTVQVSAVVADTFRQEWGKIVATLIRTTGDWDLAEECAQDAFAQAVARWPSDGVPQRPGAWIVTAARNRAIDRLRRSQVESVKLRELVEIGGGDPVPENPSGIADDRLRLLFTCCHPALALEARVALTLRTLAGLGTAEIARACLVSEATMAKRLQRAKEKIRNAGIPYRVPAAEMLPSRLSGVLSVIYLLFNEGYSASEGDDPLRPELAAEAIRLARLLVELMPQEPEAKGLLALLLLHDSRQAARVDAEGLLVPLEEQDRSLWRRDEIDAGIEVLESALDSRDIGPYQLQALIAAVHATAPSPAATDWEGIVRLYEQLRRVVPSAVVELNHAVAVAMARGPAAGLALVEEIKSKGQLSGYPQLPATSADLLRRLGRHGEAAADYRAALALAPTEAQAHYLRRRLESLPGGGKGSPTA